MSYEWAAGLFEGEGCLHKSKNAMSWRIQLRMTDRDVVEHFAQILSTGNSIKDESNQPSRIGYKPSFVWQCSRQIEVKRILINLLPYLGHRRAHKVLDCLDDYEYRFTDQRAAKIA